MIVAAALCTGAFFALLAGYVTGVAPRFRWRLAPAVRRDGHGQRLWLQQAGLTVSPVQFWLGSAAAAVAAFVLLAALTRSPFVAAIPAVAVAGLPRAYFGRRRQHRLRLVQAAWPDGLRDLLASISAGRSLGQAVQALTTTGPAPLREAFARFPELARMLGTVPALEIVREELADPTSDRILEVLILAHERGGGVVRSILEDLVTATTKDLKLAQQLETEGLEMRINSRAVVVLPWTMLVLLCATDGPFRVFYGGAAGTLVLLFGAALSALGVVLLGRLGREPGEPRVFGSSAGARS